MIIDLHTHTRPLSDDSELSPDELIERAKQAGLDGVCLTEHDWFWDRQAANELGKEHNFLVLPGAEIDTEVGHILVFGMEKHVFGMHEFGRLKEIVSKAGGAMVLAHPYRRQFYSDNEINDALEQFCQKQFLHEFQTVETYNGRASSRQNRFSQEVGRRLGLKGTGGSDGHSFADIPSCATQFERDIHSIDELIAELKEGRFKAVDMRQERRV